MGEGHPVKTQYIPRGSDLVASAFRRLDREIAILHRQIALSALFSWNLESYTPRRGAPVRTDPVERKRSRWKLVVAVVLACLALCACGGELPEARELTRPEIETLFSSEGLATWTVDYAWEQASTGKLVIVAWRKTQ